MGSYLLFMYDVISSHIHFLNQGRDLKISINFCKLNNSNNEEQKLWPECQYGKFKHVPSRRMFRESRGSLGSSNTYQSNVCTLIENSKAN